MSARRPGIAGTPLLDWGDTLRAAKARHRRRVRRIGIGAVGIAVLLSTVALPPAPRLVWNASASAPIGLYVVSPGTEAQPGDMVVAWLPEPYRRLAATRRYVPLNVPLVKRVSATAGDEVCSLGGPSLRQRAARRRAPGRRSCGTAVAALVGMPAAARGPALPPDGRARIVRRTLFRGDRGPRYRRQGAAAMGLVRLWIAAVSAFHAGPVNAETVADWHAYIVEASSRFGVPTAWIERVIEAESGGRTMLDGRPIRSSAGAMGLMQLMPGTWADMRARLGLGSNHDDPRGNILAGTLYLRLMYDRFGYPGLFAAYNAGPGRYADYLAGHARLPAETAAYLTRVAPPSGQVTVPIKVPPPSLFAVRREVPVVDPSSVKSTVGSLIFVELSKADRAR